MTDSNSCADRLETAVQLLTSELADNPQAAAVLAYDLHAIRNGWDTVGSYDMLTWVQARTLLSDLSASDLESLLGPPVKP